MKFFASYIMNKNMSHKLRIKEEEKSFPNSRRGKYGTKSNDNQISYSQNVNYRHSAHLR